MRSKATRISDLRARVNKIIYINPNGQPYTTFTKGVLASICQRKNIPSNDKTKNLNIYKFLEKNPQYISLAEEKLNKIENEYGIYKVINRSYELTKAYNHKTFVDKYNNKCLIEWFELKNNELSEILNISKEKSQEIILNSFLFFLERNLYLLNNIENKDVFLETLKSKKEFNLLMSNKDLRAAIIYITISITIGCVLY